MHAGQLKASLRMALSYLLLLVPKCVPWPTPVHTHRAAVGAARALLQVFRSLAAVCSPSIVAFDFGFSDRSFSATLCEKDNPERKPTSWACPAAQRGVLNAEGASATTVPKCTKVHQQEHAHLQPPRRTTAGRRLSPAATQV